jgi:hypothetical protein
MSRRDARKATEVHLPDGLRKRLVVSTEQHLPLAYLARQALRRALDAGQGWAEEVSPGSNRPILVQLSTEERARLDVWMKRSGVSEEVAVLSLISTVV